MIKRLCFRIVFYVGCLALLLTAYVSIFYIVKNKVIQPYEHKNSSKTHSIRPLYNAIYYPLRIFVANGSSFHPDIPDEYFGTLDKRISLNSGDRNYRSAYIDRLEDGSISIGFTGSLSTIRKFDQIENGSYVGLTFGRTLTKEHDRFINRLLDSKIIDLVPDPRIKDKEYSEDQRRAIETQYDNLRDEENTCALLYVSEYKQRVLEHCLQARYAENIGGGCFHLMPYSVTTSVLENVINNCSTVTLQSLKSINQPN